MKHKMYPNSKQSGMALVTALIFITICVMVLIALMGRYTQQRLHVDRFEDYYLAFEGAEAAVHQCIVETETGAPGIIGINANWEPVFDANGQLVLPSFYDEAVTPEVLASMPDVAIIGFTHPWFGDGRDSNGDGVVDSLEEFGMFSIHTAGIANGQVRQLESVYSSADVNIWNNAIFAGAGQAGGLINGNVSIHGSVHLLGDNLDPNQEAITAVEFSGTALISNDYIGMPADLRQRIPDLPQRMYNDEMVDTLNTVLRVKQGLVSLSGNSRIGREWASGSGYKGPVDSTFVTNGWSGNSVTDDGDRGIPDPARFYSDNGHTEGYDLGDRVPMPYLSDDWREPDGTRVMNPDTGTWYTHEDYFTEVLLADPAVTNDGIYTGDIVLNARSQESNAVYWNSTTEQYLTGAAALAATPNAGDDYLKFDPMANTLLMNGQIRINGNLTFSGQGNQRTINYSGRAAILVDGEVAIDTDLLACNNGDPGNVLNSFPVNNIMGLMATGDMSVGGHSQMSIMGAFYSENTVSCSFQTNITGTIVGNYFSMGSQVPSIYQVPELATNLPYGMIGNYPIVVMSRESWRELGI